jgi:hypothetical protein
MPKAVAIVDYLDIRSKNECYKEFKLGSQLHKRYSPKALEQISEAFKKESADDIWAKCKAKRTKS